MPMIEETLLSLVRCPVDGQQLLVAPDELARALNQRIDERQLRDNLDALVEERFDAALVTSDAARAYPVREGIPTLIPGEAIPIPEDLRAQFQRLTASKMA